MADAKGFNSLHHAVMQNSQSTVGLILQKAPHILNIQADDGLTALHIAAYNGMLDIVSTLAKRVNCKRDLKTVAGDTALHLASSQCHITCIKALIKYGANVNAQDVDGDTSLHLVMMQSTMQDSPINFVDIALYFIENHSEIYIKNNDGKNVLDVTINPTTRKIMKKAYKKKTATNMGVKFLEKWRASGLFRGARGIRGPDWTWGDQDDPAVRKKVQSKSVGAMDRPRTVPGSKNNRLSLDGSADVDPNSLEKQWDLKSGMGSLPTITGDLSQEVDEASSHLTAGPSVEPQARQSVSLNTSIAASVGCSNDVCGSTGPREAGSVISSDTIYELPESPPAIDQENPEVTDVNTDGQVSNLQLQSVSSHLQSTEEEEPPDDNTTPDKPKTSRIAKFVQFILRIASTRTRNPEIRSERKPFYDEPSAEDGENPTFTLTDEPITNSPPPTLSQEYIDCSSELTTHVNERKTDIKKPTFPEFTSEKNEFLESFDRMLEIAKSRGIDVVGHNFQIANFAAAILDCHGGCLSIDDLDVHLYVPPGAIPEKQTQQVYIYVTGTSSVESHYFSTPFVHCGPPETVFKEDVVLTMPHCVKNTSSCKFALFKLSSGGSSELREGFDVITVVDNDSITFSVNHFCGFGATASPVDGTILEKTMIACLFIHEDSHSENEVTLRLRLVDDVQANVQEVTTEERNYGFHLADTNSPLTVFMNDQDVVAKISSCSESWELSEPEPCQRKIHHKSLWRETDASCARAFPSVMFVAKRRSGSRKDCFTARMTVLQEGSRSCDYGVNFVVERCCCRSCVPNPGEPQNTDEFLLRQIPKDRKRVTGCRLLQEPIFSKLCELLDSPNPLGNDWTRLLSLLLKTEHHVDSINAKAGRQESSPTKIVLDLFFGKQSGKKKEETLNTLKCALIDINRPDAMFAVDAIEEQIQKLAENIDENANLKIDKPNTKARKDLTDSAYYSFIG
ncbi:uncharacterized protein [Asterias amurensis]|uniref:uncharacterized protein n=1 Tax=Asterias amurensis TaxID=7602 RepID=UPI003AB54404